MSVIVNRILDRSEQAKVAELSTGILISAMNRAAYVAHGLVCVSVKFTCCKCKE